MLLNDIRKKNSEVRSEPERPELSFQSDYLDCESSRIHDSKLGLEKLSKNFGPFLGIEIAHPNETSNPIFFSNNSIEYFLSILVYFS